MGGGAAVRDRKRGEKAKQDQRAEAANGYGDDGEHRGARKGELRE